MRHIMTEAASAKTEAAKTEMKDVEVKVGKDLSTATINGTKVEISPEGSLIVYTNGTVKIKPVPANDTSKIALETGYKMADGSIFADLTADGKQQIFAMPTDLDVAMTFNDTAKAVKKLNSQKSLGHDDWQILSLENVRVLYKNQNEGALKGTFKTAAASGSDYPDWYWSSTQDSDYSSLVYIVRFSGGTQDWGHKDTSRLSCRPVRLVAASSPAPG